MYLITTCYLVLTKIKKIISCCLVCYLINQILELNIIFQKWKEVNLFLKNVIFSDHSLLIFLCANFISQGDLGNPMGIAVQGKLLHEQLALQLTLSKDSARNSALENSWFFFELMIKVFFFNKNYLQIFYFPILTLFTITLIKFLWEK